MNEQVKPCDMTEKELENYLAANPNQIGEGFKLLRQQFPTDSGPLDMLLSDGDGGIWVTELKINAEEGHLDQGLRYYDYVRANIESISHAFKIDERREPGLALISTDFSEALLRIVKYINVPLELVEAIPIMLPSGEKQVLCRSKEYGAPYSPPDIPTREGNLSYIQDKSVRELCRNILDNLEKRGVSIQPLKGNWFSMRKGEGVFLTLGCRQQHLSVYVGVDEENYSDRIKVERQSDWDGEVEPHLSWLDDT